MVRLGPAEYLDLLLKAHSAEDALQPLVASEPREPWPSREPVAPGTPLPTIDLEPVFGLLEAAESVVGLDAASESTPDPWRNAAAAA